MLALLAHVLRAFVLAPGSAPPVENLTVTLQPRDGLLLRLTPLPPPPPPLPPPLPPLPLSPPLPSLPPLAPTPPLTPTLTPTTPTPTLMPTPTAPAPVRVAVFTEGELPLLCGVLLALCLYIGLSELTAWLELPAAPPLAAAPPTACRWAWRALRCSRGCKMLLPGRCKPG